MLRADMTSDASDAPPSAPTVWILLGHRAGDNGQALALADALGWPATANHLRYTGLHHAPNWLLGDSCRPVAPISNPLQAPWPHPVNGVGQRRVPVAPRTPRHSSTGEPAL